MFIVYTWSIRLCESLLIVWLWLRITLSDFLSIHTIYKKIISLVPKSTTLDSSDEIYYTVKLYLDNIIFHYISDNGILVIRNKVTLLCHEATMKNIYFQHCYVIQFYFFTDLPVLFSACMIIYYIRFFTKHSLLYFLTQAKLKHRLTILMVNLWFK